ncbi:hypothetical protein QFZ79_003125 [Arthrobacter sp. V4I6]|uniref:hypothetical protein n=1 Tax=unclassified Arthrobacter TaxID=235627 RepID=UPI00278ADF8A|nr:MULTISPECIES: hypothetical protein [unclassified Arthrobacter]MDQ0820752.1 hypothetical protein [Arthrobacter sp. V1I7]MDQ0855014.1 hypothetical protein [Arthrobacter sp. V4I6]
MGSRHGSGAGAVCGGPTRVHTRTIDSRLREVYDADIDADDVHTTGNAMAPQPQYADA